MTQRPDLVKAQDSGQSFAPHPEGQFAGVCVDVVDLGMKLDTYPGKDAREVHKVALVYASGELKDDGTLHTVSVEMTVSMSEKANLRAFLQSWRGKSYTEDQARQGVPLDKLCGQPALMSVEHKQSKRGRTYACISSITPLPKAMEPPDVDAYTRPDFWAERKKQYADEVAKHHNVQPITTRDDGPEPEYDGDDGSDDSLPF